MSHYFENKNIITNFEDPLLDGPYQFIVRKDESRCSNHEIWVANSNSGTVTHYNFRGETLPYSGLIVPPVSPATIGSPRGLQYNNTNGFLIPPVSGPALKSTLLVATADGQILGWNPLINPTTFISMYTSTDGASYTSLSLVGNLLYATDFVNGKIDVFDNLFVKQTGYDFLNPIPIPFYVPFGIQNLEGNLFVTYVMNNGGEVLKAPGFGVVNVFDYQGNLVRRLVNSLEGLNAPYGQSEIPRHFLHPHHNSVLIGNYGDGQIEQRDAVSGEVQNVLKDKHDQPLYIDTLTDINDFKDVLLYTSAPTTGNTKGTFGYIKKREKCYNPCKY